MGGNEMNQDEPMDVSAMNQEKKCYLCKKMGHIQRDCCVKLTADGNKPATGWKEGSQQPGNSGRKDSKICFNCGKNGHFARDCQ